MPQGLSLNFTSLPLCVVALCFLANKDGAKLQEKVLVTATEVW